MSHIAITVVTSFKYDLMHIPHHVYLLVATFPILGGATAVLWGDTITESLSVTLINASVEGSSVSITG